MRHEPATVGRKRCRKCNEVKSVLAFASNPEMADGMRRECRPCWYELYGKSQEAKKKLRKPRRWVPPW